MFQQEADTLAFLLNEEFTEDIMSIMNINQLQGEAQHSYDHVPASEGAAWAQVVVLCEIAQQLARIATQLEDGMENIAEQLHIIADAK